MKSRPATAVSATHTYFGDGYRFWRKRGEAEVQNLYSAICRDHHVVGLDVATRHAAFVSVLQSSRSTVDTR
jgi:hypothetical protein